MVEVIDGPMDQEEPGGVEGTITQPPPSERLTAESWNSIALRMGFVQVGIELECAVQSCMHGIVAELYRSIQACEQDCSLSAYNEAATTKRPRFMMKPRSW